MSKDNFRQAFLDLDTNIEHKRYQDAQADLERIQTMFRLTRPKAPASFTDGIDVPFLSSLIRVRGLRLPALEKALKMDQVVVSGGYGKMFQEVVEGSPVPQGKAFKVTLPFRW